MSDDYDYSECDKLFERELPQPRDDYDCSGAWYYWDLKRQGFRSCYRLLLPDTTNPERELADTVASQHKSVNKTAPVSPGTDYKELEQRLRRTRATMLGTEDEQHFKDCHDVADAIRQQAESFAKLERDLRVLSEVNKTHFELWQRACDKSDSLKATLTAAQQRLERWEG